MKVASTKLANPEWEALQNKCNERGVTIAEHLRDLIRTDSNKTPLRADEQAGREKVPVIENSKHPETAPASSLAWLTGKRPAATSNVQSESSTLVEDMREQVRKQGQIIQSLSSQLSEVTKKVEEQGRRNAIPSRPDRIRFERSQSDPESR